MLTAILSIILLFVWLMLTVTALVHLVKNYQGSTGMKIVWAIVVLFVPIVGAVIYLIVAKKSVVKALDPRELKETVEEVTE